MILCSNINIPIVTKNAVVEQWCMIVALMNCPGGGGVLGIFSDGDDRRMTGIFLGWKIWQVFF